MTERASTGIPGLDRILGGGLPRDHMFLLEGRPGCGKTTLAMQFLREGASRDEPGLFVTNSETKEEVRKVAASHGWDLANIHVHEWQGVADDAGYTIFHATEVELTESMGRFLREVERLRPRRLVFDSIVGLRILAPDEAAYRRQIQRLREHFESRPCTVVLIDDSQDGDPRAQTMVHGVIQLQNVAQSFGPERRQLRVVKMRGVRYGGGFHDFAIETGGVVVYPRLVALDHPSDVPHDDVGSGVEELDALLGGGVTCGSSTLLIGPAGVGKSTLAAHYALAAADRGGKAWVMMFDEVEHVFRKRLEGLGIPVENHVREGNLRLTRVDPASVTPGWLSDSLVRAVHDGLTLFVLDSLNGYLQAMAEERHVAMHLRELLTFLGNAGVVTVMTMSQHGVVGPNMISPIDVSYIADTVLLLRYFEHAGEVRQAISVVKKRTGAHERTIRELRIGRGGILLGAALSDFRGVLTGVPGYRGGGEEQLRKASPE